MILRLRDQFLPVASVDIRWQKELTGSILTHLLRYKKVGLEEKKLYVFCSFLFIVSFLEKSMFS
jgi:hypothetical protein